MLIHKLKIYIEDQILLNPSYRNVRTVFKNLIGPEFKWGEAEFRKDLFEQKVFKQYRAYLEANNRTWAYVYNSYIKKLREAVVYCLDKDIATLQDYKEATNDMTANDTLEYLVKERYAEELSEYLKVKPLRGKSQRTVNSFIDFKLGNDKNHRRWIPKNGAIQAKTATKLEKALRLPVGSLSNKVDTPIKRVTTSKLVRRTFPQELDANLLKEIEDFLNWKQFGVLPDTARQEFADDWDIGGASVWQKNKHGYCGSRRLMKEQLLTYSKFALHARDVKKVPSLQEFKFTSLDDIVFNRRLIEAKINDAKELGQGMTNMRCILKLYAANCQWEEGYLAAFHWPDADEEKCKKFEKYLRNQIKGNISIDANPDNLKLGGLENVGWFIEKDYDYILGVYKKTLDWLVDEAKASTTTKKLSYYETALWLWIGFQVPLRIENFNQLKIGNKGDAYLDVDAGKLFVHIDLFKNRKQQRKNGKKSLHQTIQLPEWMQDYLDTKEKYQLPRSAKARTDYLFAIGNIGQLIKTYTATALHHIFPDENHPGWNPHSIRHVAASLYLRKNRQDWDGLASLLRDDYQTVRKTYAHLSEVEETTNLEQKMELQLEALNSANKT